MKEEKYWILLSKKIAGEASGEELELLAQLTNGNPEWKTIMENLQELWNSQPRNANTASLQKNEDAYLTHINRLKEKVTDFETGNEAYFQNYEEAFPVSRYSKPFYRRLISAAAILVVSAGIYVYAVSGEKNDKTKAELVSETEALNQINVGQGSRSKIQLPDGSQVWVNSGSKLTYGKTFTGNTREITLDGEAYFDVVKDPNHPFIVHTAGIDIKVLGTAFNVKAYNIEPTIEATLVHGSIEVIKKDQQQNGSKIMLKPHEKIIFYKYADTEKRDQRADVVTAPGADALSSLTIRPLAKNIADSDIVETAWVYNKLVFEDERFEDLAYRMEKWYNIHISIEADKIRNSKITGTFINETVEQALKELQFLVPFSYAIKGNEIKIIKK